MSAIPDIVDDFNRADETPLTTGGIWTDCNGLQTHNLVSNAIRGTNWNAATGYIGTAGGATAGLYPQAFDIALGAKVWRATGWTNADHFGAFLRISQVHSSMWNSHYYRIWLHQSDASTWSIVFERFDQSISTGTNISTASISAHSDGDEYLFVSKQNGDLLALRNGSLIASANDTTAGYYDIGGYTAFSVGYMGATAADQAIGDDIRVGMFGELVPHVLFNNRSIRPRMFRPGLSR